MEEGGEEEAGASEGEESDEGGDEGSSLGEGVDETPSWLHECFESAEAEQEYWDWQERENLLRKEKQRRIAGLWAVMIAGKRVDSKSLEGELNTGCCILEIRSRFFGGPKIYIYIYIYW